MRFKIDFNHQIVFNVRANGIRLHYNSFPRSAWECNIVENKNPHFLTCTVINWIPVFAEPEIVKIVLDSLDYLQQHKRVCLYGYVILENHLHLIADADDLSKEIGDFKSFSARKIIDYLKDKHATTIINQLEYYKLPHKQDRDYQLW